MKPRAEVTIHLTAKQYENLVGAVCRLDQDASWDTRAAIENATFDPLLDERVTVGSSFKRGQG